jgi:hypothetical protein
MGFLVKRMGGWHKVGVCASGCLIIMAGMVLSRRASAPVVRGGLSEPEVSEILRAVRHDMWQTAFPDRSWSTLRRCPRTLWALATAKVFEVNHLFRDRTQVKVQFSIARLPTIELRTNYWSLSRQAGQWVVTGHGVVLPRRNWQAPTFEEGQRFSIALSNETQMSFDGKPQGRSEQLSLQPSTRFNQQ